MVEESASGTLPARILLNTDGRRFDDLDAISRALEPLTNAQREAFRDVNASAIAKAPAGRLLVIAGPGAGKSRLFLSRIGYWLKQQPNEGIYVASFVRKLINDLRTEIETKIDEKLRDSVSVTTLHTLARSIIEKNNGSRRLPLRQYVRVIAPPWDGVVWSDTMAFRPDLDSEIFTRTEHDRQLHTGTLEASPEWTEVCQWADELSRFFNAVGFAQMVALARSAIQESPALMSQKLWIFDEYQDFNDAEDALVRELTAAARGLVLAGDDDQALYQELKAARPEIIIGHYNDDSFAKAMLPFCGRCSYYVCRAAATFMQAHRSNVGIEKVYLPLVLDEAAPRVRIVAMGLPMSIVDYVDEFLSEQVEEFSEYQARVAEGTETDAFLLILSQNGCLTRTRGSDADRALSELVGRFGKAALSLTTDYAMVLAYGVAGWNESDNFAVRKVLDYEDVAVAEVHEYIASAIERARTLADVVDTARPEILGRAREVSAILDSDDLTAEGVIEQLAEVLTLKDPDGLRADLDSHPIKSSHAREDEDEAAIDLGGPVVPVALMTMFKAKGLSAHHVMVVGCDDANMDRTGPLPFYVALSRSRKSLHLLMARQAGGAQDFHQFVWELPEDCCEYLTFTKTRGMEVLNGRDALRDKLRQWRLGAEYGQKRSKFRNRLLTRRRPRRVRHN